ncbi:MAG TPA: hypothetical protein VGI66_18555 [Streptosporangiaceae bacterium]
MNSITGGRVRRLMITGIIAAGLGAGVTGAALASTGATGMSTAHASTTSSQSSAAPSASPSAGSSSAGSGSAQRMTPASAGTHHCAHRGSGGSSSRAPRSSDSSAS